MNRLDQILTSTVDKLSDTRAYPMMWHEHHRHIPMPSIVELEKFVSLCRGLLFPGFFGESDFVQETLRFTLGSDLQKAHRILSEQIKRGFCFAAENPEETVLSCTNCEIRSEDTAAHFIETLPEIRRLLSTDVIAAYEGDPAAQNPGEAIFCYPSIVTLTHHRIAHELLKLHVPLIPRIISEMAHSKTGIDIHPGATIGEGFFIDHGTGVVIGETCIIGNRVRLYQGVTLGAKSFPMDENGNPIKGIPRHPIVEDDVIVYSGATVLGRITIGKGSTIGGNVWVTEDVPKGSKVLKSSQSL